MTRGGDGSSRVSAEHRLLLRAVLLRGEPALEAWKEWRSSVDVDLVDAPAQRLLPLLARRLGDVAPDDPIRNLVRGIYRHAWARNQMLWRAALPVLRELERAGLPTVLLKGASLLRVYGDDWGARPMYDVDVLVPYARAAEAIDVLDRRRWVPEQGQTAAWVRWRGAPRRHGWGFTHGDARIDLHWHVLGESIGADADDRFWACARTGEVGGFGVRFLDPAHLLLHVLAHGNAPLNSPPIQWIADAVTIIRAVGTSDPDLDRRFAQEAGAQGLQRSAAEALDVIGSVLSSPDLVAALIRAVEREPRRIIGRLRDAPWGGEPLRQLARHSAGGTGLVRGAAALVRERLDLALTTRPVGACCYAMSLRAHTVARVLRRRDGSFVRTPVGDAPRLVAGVRLDFTDPSTLDRYGAVGWGRTELGGATTRGAEPRLVLPLDPGLAGRDLVVTLAVEAREQPSALVVVANETPLAVAVVPTTGTRLRVRIPSETVGRFRPLELALRRRRGVLGGGGSVRLRLRSIELACDLDSSVGATRLPHPRVRSLGAAGSVMTGGASRTVSP